MKIYRAFLFFFFLFTGVCRAQQPVLVATRGNFTQSGGTTLPLSDAGEWLFKAGTDTTGAAINADVAGWRKLPPARLSVDYADKSGRVEGWFRIRLKMDSSLAPQHFSLSYFSWAAADIYINGKLILRSGEAGYSRATFRESRTMRTAALPVDLQLGQTYLIAMHVVDYVAPLPPRRLMSADLSRRSIININTQQHAQFSDNLALKNNTYEVIWGSVCMVLSLLSWLLFFQNRSERNLWLIAVCCSSYGFFTFFLVSSATYGISYYTFSWFSVITSFFAGVIFVTVPFIIAGIFKRKIPRLLRLLLLSVIVFSTADYFTPVAVGDIFAAVVAIGVIVICIYYLVSSWKNLHGAQWAIVFGLITSFLMLICLLGDGILASKAAFQNTDIMYLFATGFTLSFPISMMVYVALRFKEIIAEVRLNADEVVRLSNEKRTQAEKQQKVLEDEVARQTAELRTAFENLKATQTQLIQSEKMASLGELTAGIAHEIQNPLNFVNNFSEVSVELLEELTEEAKAGHNEDVISIAGDLAQNLEKIRHHGKRADFIVKGMLEHSRASTGAKEPTDLNKLADEYLRLAYHGFRAKNKSFNAELVTHFDENLPHAKVIAQDMGRVLLNLFNNAFYAVNQKQKTADADYKPEVSVTTSAEKNNLVITVKDNGNGIPDAIKGKIMQPFFTTKPTGEGTGLGLSLSYDIVVKGHGGSIQVNSVEGEGAEFIVWLPVKN